MGSRGPPPPYYAANDAWAQQSYVMKGIQACAAMWTSRQNAAPRRQRLALGKPSDGSSLFNTIIPPSSMNYPWSGCRADNQGGAGL